MDQTHKYINARVPKRFRGLTLGSYNQDTDDPSVAPAFDYVAHLEEHLEVGLGLLLVGPPGTGKTYLACAVLQHCIDAGYTGMFLTMPELIRTQHKLMDLKDAWQCMRDEDAYIEWLRRDAGMAALRNEIQFLVLDDVGKEHTTVTGYSESLFDEIFRHRYDNGLPTIITTNIEVKQWSGRYSPAMADFLHEACVTIGFEGASFRRGNRGRG